MDGAVPLLSSQDLQYQARVGKGHRGCLELPSCLDRGFRIKLPIPSVYGLFTYIQLVFDGINVGKYTIGKYTIPGCYGIGSL